MFGAMVAEPNVDDCISVNADLNTPPSIGWDKLASFEALLVWNSADRRTDRLTDWPTDRQTSDQWPVLSEDLLA